MMNLTSLTFLRYKLDCFVSSSNLSCRQVSRNWICSLKQIGSKEILTILKITFMPLNVTHTHMSITLVSTTCGPILSLREHSQVTLFDLSFCPHFNEAAHVTLHQRCLDIACNDNMQDLNKLQLRPCLDSFLVPQDTQVWLLEDLSVNYQHYFYHGGTLGTTVIIFISNDRYPSQ